MFKVLRKFDKFVAFAWLVVSIMIYTTVTRKYSYEFNVFCAVYYVLMSVSFFFFKAKKNYLDFDTIFIIVFFLVLLFYPVFIYPVDPGRYIIFKYSFNEKVINQGTSLAVMGMAAYMFGSTLCGPNRKPWKEKMDKLSSKGVAVISVSAFAAFFFTGGWDNLVRLYGRISAAKEGIYSYFMILASIFAMIMVVIWFNNLYVRNRSKMRFTKIPILELVYVVFFMLMILVTGSRTVPMQIMLIVVGLYACLYHRFSFKSVVLLLTLGIILMYGVLLLRDAEFEGSGNFSDSISDLIVNARNTYVSLDIVDHIGYTYGVSMLGNILSPLPFMQNLVCSVTGIPPYFTSSSMIFTTDTLGKDSNWGLGSNIIADVYLAFGPVGVVIMMCLLGYMVAVFLKNCKRNSYALMGYAVMVSYSVYLVRAEYFFFLRFLVWGLLTVAVLRWLKRLTRRVRR